VDNTRSLAVRGFVVYRELGRIQRKILTVLEDKESWLFVTPIVFLVTFSVKAWQCEEEDHHSRRQSIKA
jgi:hypothetical protein